MKVCFWGTTGSLSAGINANTIRDKLFDALKLSVGEKLDSDDAINSFIDNNLPFNTSGTFGNNTSCVEIRGGNEFIILDAGTGIRDFGNWCMRKFAGQETKEKPIFHIFLSHLHWDHIQGFPFFTPAYIPGNTVNVYGFHPDIKDSFLKQQSAPNFPVPLNVMGADINFKILDLDQEHEIAGFKIRGMEQNHPDASFGYRFEKDGRAVVYSTDSEHKEDSNEPDYHFIPFFKDADLLIFDAMYSLLEAIDLKEDWGHSSNLVAVELACRSKVKRLCLFHHEPVHNDATLSNILENTRKYLKIFDEESQMQIDTAYDGLCIKI